MAKKKNKTFNPRKGAKRTAKVKTLNLSSTEGLLLALANKMGNAPSRTETERWGALRDLYMIETSLARILQAQQATIEQLAEINGKLDKINQEDMSHAETDYIDREQS